MITEKKIKEWYDKRYILEGVNTWRPFEAYPVYLDKLGVKRRKKLLDIGCGMAHLLRAADQRCLGTYGVDISKEGVKLAEKNSPNSKIIIGKGEELDFPNNYFDYVVCLGTLEHFLDMEKGIREMIRVGKRNARYCVSVPNKDFLYWKVKRMNGTEQFDINETLHSLEKWKELFIGEGFEILKIEKERWFLKKPNIYSRMTFPKFLRKFIYKLIWLMIPLRYTYQFVFIMRKC